MPSVPAVARKHTRWRSSGGGTDNHLILIDLTSKGVAGKPAAQALDRARITTEPAVKLVASTRHGALDRADVTGLERQASWRAAGADGVPGTARSDAPA